MKVARNLGKTLRAFQPTVRELQVDLLYLLSVKFENDALMNTALLFLCRMFLGNSRAPLNERLVLMTFQLQSKTHTTTLTELTPSQLLHQLPALRILRLLLTPVSD